MARAKKGAASAPTGKAALALTPLVQLTDMTPAYYINHAEVSSNPYEICITVARLPSKLTPERLAGAQDSGHLEVDAELQILFAPSLLIGLIRALSAQKEAYEAEFGPLIDPGVSK